MTEAAAEPKVMIDGQVPDWLKGSYEEVLRLVEPDAGVLRLRLGFACTPDQCTIRLWLSAANVSKASEIAREVMLKIRGDRQTYIRRAPIAEVERDFEYGTARFIASARFIILNRKGTIQMLALDVANGWIDGTK